MSSVKKSFTKWIAVLAYVFSLCSPILPVTQREATAAVNTEVVSAAVAESTASGGYYYDNLTISNKEYDLGKKFYNLLDEMRASGDFKDGIISRKLDGIVSSDLLKAWVEDGDLTVPKAFGAARDSFLMDHPELFYIDVYKIMISAGYSGGKYQGYVDSGREPNIYRDNAFKSEEDVNKAIAKYDAAVKTFADAARSHVDEIGTIYQNDARLAIAANNEVASKVKYDYSVYSDYLENGENAETIASLAHTSYGALVNRKAVCSGYSFGYKAVLDALGIPSVVVSGYSVGKDRTGADTAGNVAHSWNYVKLEIANRSATEKSAARAVAEEQEKVYDWFAFDTTWNSVTAVNNKYAVMHSVTASEKHMPEPIISSSNYPLSYPALSQVSYIQAVNSEGENFETESDGFSLSKVCFPSGDSYEIKDYISYHGKNSGELVRTENLRMVMRQYFMEDGEKKWTKWQDLANSVIFKDYMPGVEDYLNGKTLSTIAGNVQKVQYAVVGGLEPDENLDAYGHKLEGIYYSDAEAVVANAIYLSEEIENPVYGTYTPAPYVLSTRSTPIGGTDVSISSGMSEPGNSAMMADNKAITVKLVYDEPLHVLDPSKDVKVNVTARVPSALDYSGFAKFSDGKTVHLVKDEKGVLNTLEFKFKPSLMFEHNRVGYTFSFENVGSAKIVEKKTESGDFVTTTSDRAPNTAYYVFSRIYYTCPKVFGDGRLYVDCCAQPTLVDNSDLSATNFLDENDNSTFSESSRSQMMLVVNDVSPQTESAIVNEIDADASNGISKNDIQKSQTYDINLQICGKYAKIPDRSYVRLALGFPEGYGPDDEGVTFKIFHRKHIGDDRYEIEEIPCVVTKFGIVVTVSSFSPYTVVVVPEDKVTTRTIAASIDGKGGTLSKDDGRIREIEAGGSYTYTLTPAQGYHIYRVLLNGEDVTERVTEENTLTVGYEDLGKNNELEIKYISGEAKVRYEANNIVDPVKIIIPVGTDLFGKGLNSDPASGGSNVGLIVGIIVGVVVLAGAAAVAVLTLRKKTVTVASTRGKSSGGKSSKSGARSSQKNDVRPSQKSGARSSQKNGKSKK